MLLSPVAEQNVFIPTVFIPSSSFQQSFFLPLTLLVTNECHLLLYRDDLYEGLYINYRGFPAFLKPTTSRVFSYF